MDDFDACIDRRNIDGVGNVLGRAGHFFFSNGQPINFGFLNLDAEDVPNLTTDGRLVDVVIHEFGKYVSDVTSDMKFTSLTQFLAGHIIAMLPNRLAFFDNFDYDSTSRVCSPYRGANAIREFTALLGCGADTPPPMQNPGCGHWDEPCLNREVMTPFIEPAGNSNPFSRLTIAAMEDVGYVVDYTQADPLPAGDLGSGCVCNNRRLLRAHNNTATMESATSSARPRRRLSEAGYAAASAYGKAELTKMNEALHDVYIPAMSVVYQDHDGSVYSVVVDM